MDIFAGLRGTNANGVPLDVRADAGRGDFIVEDFDCGEHFAIEVGGRGGGARDQRDGQDRQSENGDALLLGGEIADGEFMATVGQRDIVVAAQ